MLIVWSSNDSRTEAAPLRPSIVGRIPITGYLPIDLLLDMLKTS